MDHRNGNPGLPARRRHAREVMSRDLSYPKQHDRAATGRDTRFGGYSAWALRSRPVPYPPYED